MGPRHNLAGVLLRAFSLAGKLLLVVYITRFIDLEAVGVYSVFVTTTLLAGFIAGFDFYSYSTREIIAADADARPQLVLNQAAFHACAEGLVIPALLLVFGAGFLPWSVVGVAYVVTIAAHLTTEIFRLLLALSRPLPAYVIATAANGLWVYPIMALGLLDSSYRTLDAILATWAAFAVAAAILGLIYLRRLGVLAFGGLRPDWAWIRTGLRVSSVLFIATVAAKLIDYSDRYFIQWFLGDAAVGVYSLFSSIAAVPLDVVVTGFVVVIYPRLTRSFQRGDIEEWRISRRKLVRSVLLAGTALMPCFVAGISVLLPLLSRPLLDENIEVYMVLLASSLVTIFSTIPHFILWATKRDAVIVKATVAGALLNVAGNAILIPLWGLLGAAAATLGAFSLIGAIKLYCAQSGLREDPPPPAEVSVP